MMTEKNQQRLEDCIQVLEVGRKTIGALAAMMAARAIIDKAITEHKEWENNPDVTETNIIRNV